MIGVDDFLDFVGTGLDIYSSYQQAEASQDLGQARAEEVKRAAEANAAISRYDASVAEKYAIAEEVTAGLKLRRHMRLSEQLLGTQRARYAKAGVAPGTGTPLEIMAETAGELAADADIIRYEGQTRAARQRSLAERYRKLADHGLRDAAAQASLIEDAAEAASTAYLLEGAGKAFDAMYDLYEA